MSYRRAVSLKYLSTGSITPRKLDQIQIWIDADWESHDIDRYAVKLIQKLVNAARERTQ